MKNGQIKKFRAVVRRYFREQGRDLPWRRTDDPYRIFVSEVMLQQTNVDRVALRYEAFLARFPSAQELAEAPFEEIFSFWRGLGYNRRALALKRAAGIMVREHGGTVPRTLEELDALPGIGEATAAAVLVYAWNTPVSFIETNIRAVFIHFFFPKKKKVGDKEIFPLVERTLDRKNPRGWYSALMDYGAMLKKGRRVRNARSARYRAQGRFQGSNREARGKFLALLSKRGEASLLQAAGELKIPLSRIEFACAELLREGFIARRGSRMRLASL